MKNLRSYLANGIPSPSHSKRMSSNRVINPQKYNHTMRLVNKERQDRKMRRLAKRGKAATLLNQALVDIAHGIKRRKS